MEIDQEIKAVFLNQTRCWIPMQIL